MEAKENSKRARVMSVVNQKGGVGKTTTTVNLAACLGALGKKVLLIDLDPQGNTTSGFGVNKKGLDRSVYDLLIGEGDAREILRREVCKNCDLIPSNIELAGAEIELVEMENRVKRLKQGFIAIRDEYDYVLIDCPPSLGLLTLNALTASDSVLVPIQCEYYALEGLSQLIATVRQVKRLYNPDLELEGVLLTMYDGRLNLTLQVTGEVKKFFPGQVFKAVIPRNVRLSEAPSFGKPVLYYDPSSKGTASYKELAQELIDRHAEKAMEKDKR